MKNSLTAKQWERTLAKMSIEDCKAYIEVLDAEIAEIDHQNGRPWPDSYEYHALLQQKRECERHIAEIEAATNVQLTLFDVDPKDGAHVSTCDACGKPFTYTPTYRCDTGAPNLQQTCDPCLDRLQAVADGQHEAAEARRSQLPDACEASYEACVRGEPGTHTYNALRTSL